MNHSETESTDEEREEIDEITQQRILEVAKMISKAKHVLVFTGAGMSEESGIPTFRGDDGIWKEYNPTFYANVPGLIFSSIFAPSKFGGFLKAVSNSFNEATPNQGHYSLAQLEEFTKVTIVTQNVDGLHQEAGSKRVLEVHGSLLRFVCSDCKKTELIEKSKMSEIVDKVVDPGWYITRILFTKTDLPKCSCGGLQRPDVTLFGEELPDDFHHALDAAEECDLVIVIGTSCQIYPAAGIPLNAVARDVPAIEINPIPAFSQAKVTISGASGQILPKIIEQVKLLKTAKRKTEEKEKGKENKNKKEKGKENKKEKEKGTKKEKEENRKEKEEENE